LIGRHLPTGSGPFCRNEDAMDAEPARRTRPEAEVAEEGPRSSFSAALADGRRISWAEYGRPTGLPLVMMHGTPGSRLQFRLMHEAALAADVRLVTPERPGYGRSDPVPGGVTFTGYTEDLRQLFDHLGLRSVTLLGASGGAGFAVAAAAADPQRVKRLILASAGLPAPRAARRGMALPVRAMLVLAAHAPRLARRLLATQLTADLDSPTARLARRRMPAGDRRLFDDPMWRAHFAEDFGEALRQGPGAAVDDLRQSLDDPGGMDLPRLAVDTVLVHGTADVNVPIGIARFVASQVPHARLIELPGAGHLSVLEHSELLLRWADPGSDPASSDEGPNVITSRPH
jgi:pimeloyl-ACP methyl ester carboxylesterase